MDLVFEKNNRMSLVGILDETVNHQKILAQFNDYFKAKNEPITVDMSKVQRANSIGIVEWLRFVTQSNAQLKYVKSPVWLVNQFNLIAGFFENKSFVESIDVPYFCPDSNFTKIVTLNLGSEIPINNSYIGFYLENKVFDGKEFEPDIVTEQYLSFITHHAQQFKQALGVH
jgi:ABC-type transporter Mla MlaB component